MISAKMIEAAKNNSAIRTMFEEGRRLAAQYGAENVYDFSLGNPNFPAPEALNQAIVDVVTTENPVMVHGYMPNAGFPDVRTAVAENLNARFGTAFGMDNILMTVGAAGGPRIITSTLQLILNCIDYDMMMDSIASSSVLPQRLKRAAISRSSLRRSTNTSLSRTWYVFVK